MRPSDCGSLKGSNVRMWAPICRWARGWVGAVATVRLCHEGARMYFGAREGEIPGFEVWGLRVRVNPKP
eukprot:364927-Chlamydomonas_euryale.AAC.6